MLTLTTQELYSLTGRTQPAAQIRWLKSRNWIFEIGGDSLPKVAFAYFERRMVLGEDIKLAATNRPKTNEWHVNVDALRTNSKH